MPVMLSKLMPQVAVEIPANQQDELPDYVEQLTTFHNAFGGDLRAVVESLPVPRGARVLDLACGDGFFSSCLASRLPPLGEVVAFDLSPAFLEMSRRVCERSAIAAPILFVEGNAYELPFDDGYFDAVWCAQSLISLEDTAEALREMRRVLKPGGLIAILENDEFHHVLLNISVELELRIQKALASACRVEHGDTTKYSPARNALRYLREAGFQNVEKKTVVFDRTAPFDTFTARFIEIHLEQIRGQVEAHLSKRDLDEFDRFAARDGSDSFFEKPASDMSCINALFTGIR